MTFRQEKIFLTNILIFLTFFLLGIWFYHYLLLPVAQTDMLKNTKNIENTKDYNLNLDKYFSIYNLLKKHYYDIDNIKTKDLEESSIKWLVSWLDDPYTEYFNKKENDDFMTSLNGDFEWIWAVLEKNELWVKIMSVLDNSPAKTWDLRANDIITEVNWTNIANMSTKEVISLIKWPAWKEVNLTIKRDEKFLEKKLFTAPIVIPSVSSKDLDENTAYISISTFWDKTWIDFKKELEKYKNKKWIILDFRQNWGWYLNVAVDILSNFIKEKEVVAITKYKDWTEEKFYSDWKTSDLFNWKIVLLADSWSASASEITIWALKDYQKAIIVWERTYWKGSVQDPISLADWSMVKITTAKWFTPKDKNIDKEWISPDIEVKIQDEDIEKKYDRQLEEAKKVLNSFINWTSLQLTIDKYNSEKK